MSDIRNIILMLVGITTFVLQFSNNFFLEVIKCRFSYLPGKEKLLKTIRNLVIYILVILDFPMTIYSIYSVWISINSTNQSSIDISWISILVNVIICIIAFAFALNLIFTTYIFQFTKDKYIKKLEKNIDVKIPKSLKKYIYVVAAFSCLSAVLIFIIIFSQIYALINEIGNKNDSIYIIVFSIIICLFDFSIFTILSKIKNIIEELESNMIYKVFLKNQNYILTKLFLEFDDFYLFIISNKQRFIPKSEIIEICKEEYKEWTTI